MLGSLALEQSVVLEGLNLGSGCATVCSSGDDFIYLLMVAFPYLYPDNNITFVCHAVMASSLINECV